MNRLSMSGRRRTGSMAGRCACTLRLTFAALLLVLAAIVNPVRAVGDSNEAKGVVIEHCAGCHAVPGYSKEGLITADAPSLQTIADNPHIYTIERLRGFLVKPHWPMARFRFSPTDIDNIIAFITSLRSK